MNKRKRRYKVNYRRIIIVAFLLIIVVVIVGFVLFKITHKKKQNAVTNVSVRATNKVIESAKYNIINGNLYYLYSEDEETQYVNEYDELLRIVSDYLKANYGDKDVLIEGIFRQKAIDISMDEIIDNGQYVEYVKENDNKPKYDHYVDIYQIQDGIVLINKKYRIVVDSNREVKIDGIEDNPFMEEKINQSQFIGFSEATKIVTNSINSNLESLRINSIDELSGTERLEFDGTNAYYNYQLGSSYLKINALNGEIIDESLLNPEYSIQ